MKRRLAAVVCPGSFQVLNNDHVGSLSLPAGPYVISITGRARAVALRTTLPHGWKHNIKSAIVTVGGGKGFRLKLAQ